MDLQLLYQEDQTKLDFDADVEELITLPDGRLGIILDRTYFYPTGGGQEHDTGMINSARVVEVFKDEVSRRLVHVVEGQVGVGKVSAHIDAERRLRHMQHHTAQHLLTQCLLQVTGYETVSANINGYTPSTLDIIAPQASKTDLDRAEQMANQIIYENRVVKAYFVSPDELKSIPLRRPPKVSENIRIVEIDSFDYSPCGGTHVSRTGSIGLIKVLKSERQNDKQRIHFIAGMQAMQVFRQMYEALNTLATQNSTGWQEIPDLYSKQAEQLVACQRELQVLRTRSIKYEALELAAEAEFRAGVKLVRARFENRPPGALRLLGDELKRMPDVVALLTSYDGQKVSAVVTCGETSDRDARQILGQILSPLSGRGGGDARLAQGGGAATAEAYQAFLQHLDMD